MELTEKEKNLFELIKHDKDARNIFFSKVENPKYFYLLKSEGYFDISKIPFEKKGENGIYFPLWNPILYFKKLTAKSSEIESGISDEILKIIYDASEDLTTRKNRDSILFYEFIEVISNTPNNRISLEYLRKILCLWFTKTDLLFIIPEISKKLIPKFLKENPSREDVDKAYVLTRQVLNSNNYLSSNGLQHLDLYSLNDFLIKKKYVERISQFFPVSIVFYLCDQLKNILRYSLKDLIYTFTDNDKQVSFWFEVTNENLTLKFNEFIDAIHIKEFESLSEKELNINICYKVNSLHKFENIEGFKESLERLIDNGLFGSSSYFLSETLHELDSKDQPDDIEEAFLLYIIKISECYCKKETNEGIEIIQELSSLKYRNPAFKQVCIFLISKYYEKYEELFDRLLINKWKDQLFNDYRLKRETYFLLKENALNLSTTHIKKIQSILTTGPLLDKKDSTINKEKEYIAFWKLQWLSALKENENFKEQYVQLSEKLSTSSDYFDEIGKVKFKVGDESPYTASEILKMDMNDLIQKISDFKSESWSGPTYRGFANGLEESVTSYPTKFIPHLSKFQNIPYVYIHGLISGFINAWKNKELFDWENLLSFCQKYIVSNLNNQEKLKIKNDSWGYTADWIYGIIANLIGEGVRNDDWSFDAKLIPKAERILKSIIDLQQVSNPIEKNSSQIDYPTFAINTTTGKAYRALIDCALRNKRNNITTLWEDSEKPLIIKGIEKKHRELFVFLGWYYRQFYYLDESWYKKFLNDLKTESKEEWEAFMGGYLFSYPIQNNQLLELMNAHYLKAIHWKFTTKNVGTLNKGLTRHLGYIFFWNDDHIYSEENLLKIYIDNSSPEILKDIIHFIRSTRKDYNELTEDKKQTIRNKVLEAWNYIYYRCLNDNRYKEVIKESGDLIIFFEDINDTVYPLILDSIQLISTSHNYFILDHLIAILKSNNSERNNYKIATLFYELIKNSIPYNKEKDIIEMVESFFQHPRSRPIAVDICVFYLKNNREFLRQVYKKYSN